jgi:HAD superfamily hydrolase (TIGR01549 family)
MIDWLFFDVGNVLFDDAPQDFHAMKYFHRAIVRSQPDYTFAKMLADREELGKKGEKLILGRIAARFLVPDDIMTTYRQARRDLADRYDEINLLLPQVPQVIESLARQFKLGILANQPTECRASLARRGLLNHFQVVAISDELRLRKPDPAIFEWALAQAAIDPRRAVMIGDRRDNDIVPAAQLGMKTIWIDWPSHRHKSWFPTDDDSLLFLASSDRVPYFGDHRHLTPEPDWTASSLAEVPEALEQLVRSIDPA